MDILEDIEDHLQSEDWNDYYSMQEVMLKASAEIKRLRILVKSVVQKYEDPDALYYEIPLIFHDILRAAREEKMPVFVEGCNNLSGYKTGGEND